MAASTCISFVTTPSTCIKEGTPWVNAISIRVVLLGMGKPASHTTSVSVCPRREITDEGFYLLEDDTLVLGPFQGKIACVRIPVGRGVCGTAVARNQVQRIEDVHAFDGHIACDAASNSEIVLPLVVKNQIIGVLDIDSTVFGRFTDEDEQGLRQLVAQLEKVLATTDYKKFFASVAG